MGRDAYGVRASRSRWNGFGHGSRNVRPSRTGRSTLVEQSTASLSARARQMLLSKVLRRSACRRSLNPAPRRLQRTLAMGRPTPAVREMLGPEIRTGQGTTAELQAERRRLNAETFADATGLLSRLTSPPAGVIIDAQLPDGDGCDLVLMLRKRFPTTTVLLVSRQRLPTLTHRAYLLNVPFIFEAILVSGITRTPAPDRVRAPSTHRLARARTTTREPAHALGLASSVAMLLRNEALA